MQLAYMQILSICKRIGYRSITYKEHCIYATRIYANLAYMQLLLDHRGYKCSHICNLFNSYLIVGVKNHSYN